MRQSVTSSGDGPTPPPLWLKVVLGFLIAVAVLSPLVLGGIAFCLGWQLNNVRVTPLLYLAGFVGVAISVHGAWEIMEEERV